MSEPTLVCADCERLRTTVGGLCPKCQAEPLAYDVLRELHARILDLDLLRREIAETLATRDQHLRALIRAAQRCEREWAHGTLSDAVEWLIAVATDAQEDLGWTIEDVAKEE